LTGGGRFEDSGGLDLRGGRKKKIEKQETQARVPREKERTPEIWGVNSPGGDSGGTGGGATGPGRKKDKKGWGKTGTGEFGRRDSTTTPRKRNGTTAKEKQNVSQRKKQPSQKTKKGGVGRFATPPNLQ